MIPISTVRRLLSGAVAALCLAPLAQAQAPADWPQHPVTFVMTFPAGSGVDVVARTIQEPLGKVLGQPIIIDYKVGAAGNVASELGHSTRAAGSEHTSAPAGDIRKRARSRRE